MYCKYCGKEIANDSVFCQFCGKSLIESMSDNKEIESHDDINKSSENETYNVGTDDKTQEVIVKTKEDAPLHVEISKKKENHSSTIANEIIGNLKMIGWAVVLTLVYVALFSLIRIDCLTGIKNLYDFGKGYYDNKFYSLKNCNSIDQMQNYFHEKAILANDWEYFYYEYLTEKYKRVQDSVECVEKFKKYKPIARKYGCKIKEMYYSISDFNNYNEIWRTLRDMEDWLRKENVKLTRDEKRITGCYGFTKEDMAQYSQDIANQPIGGDFTEFAMTGQTESVSSLEQKLNLSEKEKVKR